MRVRLPEERKHLTLGRVGALVSGKGTGIPHCLRPIELEPARPPAVSDESTFCLNAGTSTACADGNSGELSRVSNNAAAIATRETAVGTVARCFAGGQDLSALMVSSGWAWAYVHYSLD